MVLSIVAALPRSLYFLLISFTTLTNLFSFPLFQYNKCDYKILLSSLQYYDCDTEFRLSWVQQKFIENTELRVRNRRLVQPYTLQSTPYTLHPTPYTLAYTLHYLYAVCSILYYILQVRSRINPYSFQPLPVYQCTKQSISDVSPPPISI